MRLLLTFIAVFESIAALALVLSPSAAARFLLGAPLDEPASVFVARLTGCALFALAFICWAARVDASRTTRRIVAAMLVYNAAAGALLVHAHLGLGLTGVAMGPALLAHAAIGVWCVVCLRSTFTPR
jgi:hypothetical protein